MTMLVDFLCRFGFGMALGLVLTPSALVPPGFFRVNLLVVMGLGTFAALLAHGAVPGALWILPAAAAVVAWMGTVLWLAHRIRAGVGACGLAAALLAGAVAMAATVVPGGGAEVAGAPLQTVTRHLLSGAIVGLPVLLWMSRKTLDIPNTQSATGILYVACLAAIVGELAAQLLAAG